MLEQLFEYARIIKADAPFARQADMSPAASSSGVLD